MNHDQNAKTPNGLYSICSKCRTGKENGGQPTHCPGKPLTPEQDYQIYLKELDFLDGEWITLRREWKLVASITMGKRELRMASADYTPDSSEGMYPAEELIKTPSPVFSSSKEVKAWVNKYYPMYQP